MPSRLNPGNGITLLDQPGSAFFQNGTGAWASTKSTPPTPVATENRVRDIEYAEVTASHYFNAGENAYPNPYFLEYYANYKVPKIDGSFKLPYVNGVQGKHPAAVERTWTMDSLYEEHRGFRQREFIISGRSGFGEKDLTTFHRFRNFIETYQDNSAKHKNAFIRDQDTRLVLNFPFEGESYFCTLTDFVYTRDISSSRISFVYQLRFLTYGWATRKWKLPATIARLLDTPLGDNSDHTHWAHDCHHRATIAVENAPPDVQVGPAREVTGVERALIPIRGPQRSRGGDWGTVTNPVAWRTVWYSVREAEFRLNVWWGGLSPALRPGARRAHLFSRGWFNEMRMQAAFTLGVQFQGVDLDLEAAVTSEGYEIGVGASYGPAGFAFGLGDTWKKPPPSPQPTRAQALPFHPTPVVAATVNASDTSLADIALRELGNRNLWYVLLQLNGWQDARTRPDGSPIAPGTAVLIPAPQGTPAANPEEVYGTDLLMQDGDLVIVGDDVATVGGIACLVQNLTHRMQTDRGTNRAFPAYGLEPRVGEGSTGDTEGLLLSDVKRQATVDHRVGRLLSLSVRQYADTFKVDFEVEAITQARAKTSFTYAGAL